MGNCQAVEAAALVIQYPSGRLERLYWSVNASEVMKMNPGHYVSLIIPLPISEEEKHEKNDPKTIRFTRVKLLKSTDVLLLGHAYRLVTSEEVMKVLRAKKTAKLRKNKPESAVEAEPERSEARNSNKVVKHERHRTDSVAGRSKSWRPSLDSISETDEICAYCPITEKLIISSNYKCSLYQKPN